MKKQITISVRMAQRFLPVLLLCAAILGSMLPLRAQQMDATNKWAWSANAGWISFNTSFGEAKVYSTHLEGYAWTESLGWIHLGTYTGGGSHTYGNTGAADYGVNNDGSGKLSGFAWSATAGWINFKTSGYGSVSIDPSTGDFAGYAWSESTGWIKFNGQSQNSDTYEVNVSRIRSTVTTQAVSLITANSATGNGNITATNGADATERGVIYYSYSNTDQLIGDAGVIKASESGSFGTGAFTSSLTAFSVNAQYNARAYATSFYGTGYGARVAFWTLANVPSAPTITISAPNALDITVNVNSNPAATEFCIQETSTGKYVQADGTLGVTQVWQDAATWGTMTVSGLTTGTSYTFQVRARNGVLTETAYGATTSGVPVVVPTVSSVSVYPNATYTNPMNLDFTVKFSEAVTVTGTPQISLTIGSASKQAVYLSGSGTTDIVFRYTIVSGDLDTDGIAVGSLSANGGTLLNAGFANANLTLNNVGSTAGILVDAVPPATVGVSSGTTNGTYKAGDVISIQVNFSEAVTVTGTPQLTLETGATDRVVNYASGSGTSALTFVYTIQAGDESNDLDYQSAAALALNGGTIYDGIGFNAALTLASPGAANSLGANKNIVVDTKSPIVSNVNSSTANGSYKVGDAISIQVNFSEAVMVTGVPTLGLNSGGSASYVSGSGTTALTFTYTVGAGQSIADLDYSATNSLSLSGGTIKDAVGNDAVLTLPTVGGANSLGGQKSIVIAIVPVVTTQAVTNETLTTATGNGNITSLGVPNPTSYGVCWNTTGTPTITDSKVDKGSVSALGAFTASMTSLTMGTSYSVRAFATNAAGTAYGSVVSFTTLTVNAPDAPINIYASSGVSRAHVSFSSPASNGGSEITGYTVTSIPDGIIAKGTSSPITITGLSSGRNYTFTVAATNNVGTSVASAVSNVILTPSRPDAPENVTAIAGNTQATVSFNAPQSNGGNLITGYTVTSLPGGITATGTTSPIIVNSLTNGTTYSFTVVATNEVGNSPASQPSGNITLSSVPGSPKAVTATMSSTGLQVSFTAPDSDGGSPITGYTVTSNPGNLKVSGTSSPIKITGLFYGSYTFTVTATNAIGTSESSASSTPITVTGQSTIWRGVGVWDELSKWTNGLPGINTFAIIEGELTMPENSNVKKMELLAGSKLTIAANKTLTVLDTIRNNGTITNLGSIAGPVLVPVVFVENGGSTVPDRYLLYGENFVLPIPIKVGYELESWYLYWNLAIKYTPAAMPLNRLTLYAKWKFPTSLISLDQDVVKIYPNPASEGFSVAVGSHATMLTISNLDGRLIRSQRVVDTDYVKIADLTPGVYLVKLNGQSFKLIKR